MSKKLKLKFIGLGIMGAPIAGHFVKFSMLACLYSMQA